MAPLPIMEVEVRFLFSGKKQMSMTIHKTVSTYAIRLEAASEINSKFDKVVDELKTDRRIGVQEMIKIADMFVGYPIKGKSKKAALQAIINGQALDSSFRAKDLESDSLNSWPGRR